MLFLFWGLVLGAFFHLATLGVSAQPASQETEPPATASETSTPIPAETETAYTAAPSFTAETEFQPAATVTPDKQFAPAFMDTPKQEILVKLKTVRNANKAQRLLSDLGNVYDIGLSDLGIFALAAPSGRGAEVISMLASRPEVRYAEPNHPVWALETIPNDPAWPSQYNLEHIRAPQGWDLATGSAAVTIAILDTGVDFSHPDLAPKLVVGYDFANGDDDPQDDHGHGTHVAGIAAAASNNGIGIAGVSWGARIMPVKVLDAGGNGTYADVAAGIVWAVDQGARVVNLSLGGGKSSQVLEEAVNYAAERGALLVAATGNNGSNQVLYPAAYEAVIAVAATDKSKQWASFSNYGPQVDVAAPGVSIYSLDLMGQGAYRYRSGTSMAAPHVAGLAALLLGLPGNGYAWPVRLQIENTAQDVEPAGWDAYTGAGLIQVEAAILAALPSPTSTSLPGGAPPAAVFWGSQPTFTPAPTYTPAPHTPTPTPAPANEALSPEPGEYPQPAPSPIPEVSALAGEPAKPLQDWTMPCLGLALILAGLGLAIWAGRLRNGQRRM